MAEIINTHNLILQKLKQIRSSKEEQYGPFDQNMNRIGQIWAALLGLEKPIPGHTVCLMYTAAKLLRAINKYHQDSYDDALNYLWQGMKMQHPATEDWIKGYKKWKRDRDDK